MKLKLSFFKYLSLFLSLIFIGFMIHLSILFANAFSERIKNATNIAMYLQTINLFVHNWLFITMILLISLIIVLNFYLFFNEKQLLYAIPVFGNILLFLFYLFSLTKKKIVIKKKGWLFKGVFVILITIPSSFLGLSMKWNNKTIELPSQSYNHFSATMSTSPDKPNFIEIFSDGLDPNALFGKLNTNNMSDFLIFDNFITSSFHTLKSYAPNIKGEFYFLNSIKREWGVSDNAISDEELSGIHNYKSLANNLFPQISKDHQLFDKNTLINTILFGNTNKIINKNSYAAGWVGNARDYEQNHSYIDVLNWTKAKEMLINNGNHFFTNISPMAMPYQEFLNDLNYQKDNQKSNNIFMNDHITHPTFVTDKNGSYSLFNGNLNKSNSFLANYLNKLFYKMKHLIGPNGRSVYDNTNIIIWGDHATHIRTTPRKLSLDSSIKNRSGLLIKPALTASKIEHNDCVKLSNLAIWGPHLEKIRNYLKLTNHHWSSSEAFKKYFIKNKNFSINRKFLTYYKTYKTYWYNHLVKKDDTFVLEPMNNVRNSWITSSHDDFSKIYNLWEEVKWKN